MSSQKLIVVIGATGLQGGSVVNTFLRDPAWKVRALTRNTSSDKAQALAARSPNIEVVAADAGDADSLLSAFQGAHAIFGMTDFWTIYATESNRSKAKPGQPYPHWVGEMEEQHGRNIFDAAAKIPTLERLVFSSLANVSKWSGGKYREVLHFDSKALAVEYGEKTYPELWAKTSVIQLGIYLSNFLLQSFMTPTKSEDGTVIFNLLSKNDEPYPFVAAENETGEITKALVEKVSAGKHVIAYREMMSLQNYIGLWSKIMGVPAKLESRPSGMPEELTQEIAETFAFVEEFGFWGYEDKSVIHPKDLGVDFQFGSVEDWIKEQDWKPILAN